MQSKVSLVKSRSHIVGAQKVFRAHKRRS